MRDWFRSKRNGAAAAVLERLEPPAREHVRQHNILVLGNCQARALADCLQALGGECVATRGVELANSGLVERFALRDPQLLAMLHGYDRLLAQPHFAPMVRENFPELSTKLELYPALVFSAFHPDLVYIHLKSTRCHLRGPLGEYNSALAFWGYRHRLSVADTVALFNEDIYQVLGYFDFWQASCQTLIHEGTLADNFPLEPLLDKWARTGCFMHSVNHPKLFAVADLAATLLARWGLECAAAATDYLSDEHANGPVWPVYPEIGQRLGIDGHYGFKIERGAGHERRPVVMLGLRTFIERSFDAFDEAKGELLCDRMAFEKFAALDPVQVAHTHAASAAVVPPSALTPSVRRTPYSDLPGHHFWKDAVAMVPADSMDPMMPAPFQILRNTKVATAGSCFAQNISATLQRHRFNYHVTERGDGLPIDEVRRRNYGVFSARFGNVYTARQLLQLLERAYGRFVPADVAWRRGDGRYVDPFRPRVEPDGYESPETVDVSRQHHLHAVRHLLETMDVLIFTLGLTEGWRSKSDGAVFPLAPGVAAGEMDSARYEFVNFRVHEIVADLRRVLSRLRELNAGMRVILTVSPVPLIATYESQHVLTANSYSKSVLRAAAGEVCAADDLCTYFPSYEIVTGNYARGKYYDADLRTVTTAGVDHVMRVFMTRFAGESAESAGGEQDLLRELRAVNEIVCDEEAVSR